MLPFASVTATPNVRTPVSGDDFNCQPNVPSDFAMICPSSPTFAVSYTHAESVMLPVRCRLAGLPRSTYELEPLNARAAPFLPLVHALLTSSPLPPWPDTSAVDVPTPSENPNAASGLEAGAAMAVVKLQTGPVVVP